MTTSPRIRDSAVAARQAPLRVAYAKNPQRALTRKTARTSTTRISANDPFHGEVEIGEGFDASLVFGLDAMSGG
jgi:hypothetical protein